TTWPRSDELAAREQRLARAAQDAGAAVAAADGRMDLMSSQSPAIQVFAVEGIPEIDAGDDLARIVGDAIAGQVRPGDILAITSKIVSKAEGRRIAAVDREDAITAETVRVVAWRA